MDMIDSLQYYLIDADEEKNCIEESSAAQMAEFSDPVAQADFSCIPVGSPLEFLLKRSV